VFLLPDILVAFYIPEVLESKLAQGVEKTESEAKAKALP